MKIKHIKINNIGPYVNDNCFEFDINNGDRRMVLIGGKNGAGKTTLFNAIKICMYGCTAYGLEANNAKYFAEVEKIINSNEKLKKVAEASVIMDILFDDGKYDYIYTFNRSWRISGKKITETFFVYKDGVLLENGEKSDFENYLLQLLPPNLFKFYFFDGEKISDFIFNGNKDTDFKDAFLKLCNLDTMEIIRDNFKRITRSKNKGANGIEEAYDRCFEEDTLMTDRVAYAEDEYNQISRQIAAVDDQLVALEKEYSKSGGITKMEWKSMQEQISREEVRREDKRKWLKDIANNVLPFVILRTELQKLQAQINTEHKARIDANLRSVISTYEVKSIINGVLANAGVELNKDITKKIIEEIVAHTDETSNITPVLGLSEKDELALTAKINSLLSFDTNRVKEATHDIEGSLRTTKRIREKMDKCSIDNYEEYLESKSELNEQKSQYISELLDLDKELQAYRAEKAVSASKLAKAKADYEVYLKKQSVNDISARALLAFDELQDILYQRSIRLTEKNFETFFNALINKSDLIDGIHIDSNLNVLPYKNKTFKAAKIKSILDKNGPEYLIAQIGLHAYEILQEKLDTDEEAFELPVEVKQQLSAGEKQIFIMALYQSLSQLNKINVPYIIDTPFARIDKEHRTKILEQFFKKLNGQIIILSTDEEIVGEYKETVSDVISNTFMLNHTAQGNTEIISDLYFGG